jgi:hypothetical protein
MLLVMRTIMGLSLICPLANFAIGLLFFPPYVGFFLSNLTGLNCTSQKLLSSLPCLSLGLASGLLSSVSFLPGILMGISVFLIEVLMVVMSFNTFLIALVVNVRRCENSALKNVQKLRQIHILTESYNRLYATKVYGCTVAASSLILLISAFCALAFHEQLSLAATILFTYMAVFTVNNICFVLVLAGNVWGDSEKVINIMKRKVLLARPGSRNNKLARKSITACKPLKIKIGLVNFVEVKTTGVYLDFLVQQLASLMLLRK